MEAFILYLYQSNFSGFNVYGVVLIFGTLFEQHQTGGINESTTMKPLLIRTNGVKSDIELFSPFETKLSYELSQELVNFLLVTEILPSTNISSGI